MQSGWNHIICACFPYYHLPLVDSCEYIFRKHAILNTPLLDFLKELVEAVPDPSNGGTVDETEAGPKKRTRGKGKAKAKSDPEVKDEEEPEEESDEG